MNAAIPNLGNLKVNFTAHMAHANVKAGIEVVAEQDISEYMMRAGEGASDRSPNRFFLVIEPKLIFEYAQ